MSNFSRPKAVGLPRLKDSLLVLVDCSSLTTVQREDLFMTSRDRLSKKPIRRELEREIEEMLRESPELRTLQVRRREEDVESKLSEEKPFEEVLGRVFKASPTLKTLFLRGQRLARPFAGAAGEKPGTGSGPRGKESTFKGRRHPTFFRTVNCDYGKVYERNCELGRRCRIKFETDVENEYFDRAIDRGKFELEIVDPSTTLSSPSYSVTLEDGEANLNMALPPEVAAKDTFVLQSTVEDPIQQEQFVNLIRLTVLPKATHKESPNKPRRPPSGGGSGDKAAKQGIALPTVITVREGDERWQKHEFTTETACLVISEPLDVGGEEQLEHTFYVNVDNNSLKTEMKYSGKDSRLLEAKFKYGVVLLGVAMLHEEYGGNGKPSEAGNSSDGSEDTSGSVVTVQDKIYAFTKAAAPVLLPIIDQLSGLTEEDFEETSEIGDDE